MWRIIPAVAIVAIAAAQSTDTAEAHLGKGYDALRQDRYDVAATEFRAALKLDPALVMRARFPLAVALFELKQSADARREFEAVRSAAGDQPNIAYYLGRLDLQDQNFAGAVRNLTTAAAKPPFPDTAYYLGLAYSKQGDLAAAEKWLKRAAEINPGDSLAAYQLALVYRKQGREPEAKAAFTKSAELRRHDVDDTLLRTQCAQKLDTGSRDEAREVCQRMYDPDSAERLTALGTLYGQHGDFADALPPLQRAAELAPQAPQMQYNLALTYYQMGRFADARGPIARAVERWPDIFQLNFLYGAVLAKLGEDAEAYRVLTRAHELNAADVRAADLLFAATLRLARKSQADRQYSDAVRYYSEAVKLRPADPEPRRGLAEVQAVMGRKTEHPPP
ncbi:MAG TPA: tetratricopeptide repeat protein [Bryobacteraceae bacterium]|nr:tetratricopeptide repeat protein [Bryobacteraceae bacterium]